MKRSPRVGGASEDDARFTLAFNKGEFNENEDKYQMPQYKFNPRADEEINEEIRPSSACDSVLENDYEEFPYEPVVDEDPEDEGFEIPLNKDASINTSGVAVNPTPRAPDAAPTSARQAPPGRPGSEPSSVVDDTED
eukprot:TRINITY_DN20031_c0_g1_i2.p2 TRINITY_DN20031_c0_g1~~TRINITY_DN20031_c0_g1_i2.p2  ORF type:complete len:137 (-),score=26.98 TRINITY_DN20031_c0_g1_i2:167-577(-)